MYYTSLEMSFYSAFAHFVAQKSLQKWQRNRKLKMEFFILTGAPVYRTASFTFSL